MCTSCGCQGQGTTMTNLQTGARAEIAALPEHDSLGDGHSHGEHGHGHLHGEHQHAHDHHHGHEQGHAHGHDHSHAHAHDHSDHDQAHEDSHRRVDLEARILAKNDAIAAKCRAWLAGREIVALNLVSSPGAGKTTLLERAIADLSGELPLFVIEGDQATSNDGERIRAAGAPVVQVNTGTGCHLDAEMIARALSELKPSVGFARLHRKCRQSRLPGAVRPRRARQGGHLFDDGRRRQAAQISAYVQRREARHLQQDRPSAVSRFLNGAGEGEYSPRQSGC